MSVRINPSILAADFVNLERDIAKISNADLVHVDIMDNHFVPNLTFGLQMTERIQQVSSIPLDVHLMITEPDRWAPDYADLGVYGVTFHAEAAADAVALARTLRAKGARAGVAIKPGTSIDPYLELLEEFDQVLVMTVEPGFGGQSFMELVDKRGLDVWLQVDGGVNERTIEIAAAAGADTFVAGSSVFRGDDPSLSVSDLRARANAHRHTQH